MIVPWKMLSVTVPGVTLKQFYEEKVVSYIPDQQPSSFCLESAFLSHTERGHAVHWFNEGQNG